MKILLVVAIGLFFGTVLFGCVSDTHELSSEPVYAPATPATSAAPETTSRAVNPNLIAEESTVKIKISIAKDEYISSGVIVGDGHFAVTYAPEISTEGTNVEVTHVRSKLVAAGSIIYTDEIFDLALIRLGDDLGTPIVISQSMPELGEELIIGDFVTDTEEDLTVIRSSTVAGFEFGGLVMRFDGTVGSDNVGGPVLNAKGQLVGIVTYRLGGGESGSVFSPETFKYGLAEELVKYNETVIGSESRYGLDLIGIPAHVTKPSDWNILSGFGYFDIRSPEPSGGREDRLSDGYKVIGILNADSSAGETSKEVLDRLIAEFGEAFKRVPEFVIPDQLGFDNCELLITVEEYSRTAFERRGYVIPGGWVSDPGIYTGLCTGISKGQRVVVFAESYDVDDIVHDDGLLKKISLVQ